MTQKLALVTGGLHRVGAAISARLAREGYALAIHKRSPGEADPVLAEALAETGAVSHRFAADLSDPAAVEALVPAVIERFGRAPDLLVNNAALFAEGEWADLSAAALAEMMQVNHHAPVMLARALVAASEGRRPAIVNIVDQRVAHPVPDQIAYSLSKAALWQATATLAVAFGSRARVNAVAPGLTLATGDYSAAQVERLAKRMPLGALPTPAEVADAVAWLARAEAVTGQTIFVDGGAHLAPLGRDFVALDRD
ncbi:SDR family oxidoreductase [Sphingopyxis alaskensis]|jgi:NAD(P)-dependent dehydrogenase (short-subunit alcohol dehydrogenase family)|uniref:Short-chain dehydrogenase/reductase SDR n=1 Tax=Sphingopyxis alaskensis (strain DSM 13593 / LMG 18877 / RB2256) TaxID=317655 RepID=Q1GR98_SPHAL|nr:SDR family oxidoreductase [Sphingopyxis alaskensis]ABF53824.1 short-chain dehydrogenase/reductase SDR [Sphingopyxis alaskensis RB2256]MCM3419505.1 SDR family oxidoreductase [Sphingopyxis alaskensis]